MADVTGQAAFDRLVERALVAVMSGRSAFAASMWKRAAAAAIVLYGDDTLVAARCTLHQAISLCSQAGLEASPVDFAALHAEAWELVSSVLPLVSRRMDDDTLLPGRCTKDEVEFFKRLTLAKHAAENSPPPSARLLQLIGFGVGYTVALYAAYRVLYHSVLGPRPPPPIYAFVLRAVDMMLPASRSLRAVTLGEERIFAESCVRFLRGPAEPFIDTLRDRWTAPALVTMRSERQLADVAADFDAAVAERVAARRADIAAHGLKRCALPSCDKQEATVQQYKFCSACRSVWYCSAEHEALHWKERKPTCRATLAAKDAAAGQGVVRD